MLTAYADFLLHGWPLRFLKQLTWLADVEALHNVFCERGCDVDDWLELVDEGIAV